VLLLLLGMIAVVNMTLDIGPFGRDAR